MKIIIEGADGAGKSTLAKRIQKMYPDLDIVHMRGTDPMNFVYCYHTLDKTRVIWDRHFISERIYSKFYDLPYRLTRGQTATLVQKCRDQDIKIILCIPDNHKVMDDEDDDIKERHAELVQGYRQFAQEYDIIAIDPFTITDSELKKLLR